MWLRRSFSALCCFVAVALIVFGSTRVAVTILAAPGNAAVEYASSGNILSEVAAERALRSRLAALEIFRHRLWLAELGIVYHDQAVQQNDQSPVADVLYDQSLGSLRESLVLSPVQPLAWLLTAEIHYARRALDAAAQATNWIWRTAHYVRHQAVDRALMTIALWDRLDEAARRRATATILDVLEREPAAVSAAAVRAGVVEDLRLRLRQIEQRGVVVAAKFVAAVRRHRHDEQVRLAAAKEMAAMRRTLIATSILLSATLPSFAEAMTVHDYLAIRRGEHPTRTADSVDEYLTAVLDGLLVLGYFNRDEGNALFCVPDRHVLNIDVATFRANLDAMLEQFEAEMPSFDSLARTRSVGLVSLELLTVMYPCDS